MFSLVLVSLVACDRPVAARREALAVGVVDGAARARAAPPLLEPKEALQGLYGFGFALATGDVDGDGTGDLAVGSFGVSRVDLFLGVPGYSSGPPDWTETQPQWDQFGWAVAACDVDADGFDDLVVGASEPHVLVYPGSAAGPGAPVRIDDPAPDPEGPFLQDSGDSGTPSGPSSTAFGGAVACGDVTGDGFADVVVGAYYGGVNSGGMVHLFPGSAGGVATEPSWSASGPELATWGQTVAVLGDTNGDGYGELAAGTNWNSTGPAAVFYGGSSGPSATPDWTVDFATDVNANEIVAPAGDVNADGFADLLVGDPDNERAWLYLGGPTGLATVAAWSVQTTQVHALFGWSLGGLPDLDGDGFGELAVLAPYWMDTVDLEGAAFVFRGTADGAETTASFTTFGGVFRAAMFGVASRDLDADGLPEVVFGTTYAGVARIFAPPSEVVPGDTGTPSGETADTGDAPAPSTTPTTTGPPDGKADEQGGCGCGSTGPAGPGWAALGALALYRATRRRRTPSRPGPSTP